MSVVDRFLGMNRKELRAALASGAPISPEAIEGNEYRGISLGLPRWMENMSWKIFRKTFHRRESGELVGWNVRMKQVDERDLLAPSTPLRKRAAPWTFGHYRVVPAQGRKIPGPFDQGLLIDYGVPGGGTFRVMRDPLVAIEAGSAEVLLGWSFVELGIVRFGTPSFFLLVREGPISFVPEAAR